jgi:hypothetical protein
MNINHNRVAADFPAAFLFLPRILLEMAMITRVIQGLQHQLAIRMGFYSFPTHMQRVAADVGMGLIDIEETIASFDFRLHGKTFFLHVQHEGSYAVLMAHGSIRFRKGCIPSLLRNAVEIYSRKQARCNMVVFDGKDHSYFVVQSKTLLASFDADRFLASARLLLPYLISLERIIDHFAFGRR